MARYVRVLDVQSLYHIKTTNITHSIAFFTKFALFSSGKKSAAVKTSTMSAFAIELAERF